MSLIIRAETPSHWYKRDSTPFYECPKKDGSGMKKVDVRDARRVGAVPSVTNILSALRKPGLEAWKQEQLVLSALTLPRFPGEEVDAFAHRIVQDADAYTAKAADLGTALHAACDAYAVNRFVPTEPNLIRLFEPFRVWFDENVEAVHSSEKILVHQAAGYGGRLDLVARIKTVGNCVLDIKSQGMKQSKKTGEWMPKVYETWALQLEAYRQMCIESSDFNPPSDIVSLIVNTSAPSPVYVYVHPREQLAHYWKVFQATFEAWKYLHDYNPSIQAEAKAA